MLKVVRLGALSTNVLNDTWCQGPMLFSVLVSVLLDQNVSEQK
jgi:hypothetical protein